MNKNTKQFLIEKFTQKWLKDNKGFLIDYMKLCEELLLFRINWGVEIGIIFKNSPEIKGRELDKGLIEKLDKFDGQKFTTKTGLGK